MNVMNELKTYSFHRAPTNEAGQIQYEELGKQMNWRDFPVPPMQYQPIDSKEDWQGNQPSSVVSLVNYRAILEDVFGGKVPDN